MYVYVVFFFHGVLQTSRNAVLKIQISCNWFGTSLLLLSPPSSFVHMVYDRLLLTSSSFVDVVLFLLLLYWVWDGMASHGMVEVFVVAHICSSIECLHSVCAFIVFNRSSSYNIDMAWEINSTATKPTGSLCYVVVIAVLLFFYLSIWDWLCFQYK